MFIAKRQNVSSKNLRLFPTVTNKRIPMNRILLALVCVLVTTCFASRIGLAQDRPAVAVSADATRPLKAGDAVPEVMVKKQGRESVPLKQVYRERPIVLVFFRGGWCPICTRHTQELIKIHPQVKELGAELVGISPDSPDSTRQNVAKNSIPFMILSDADASASTAFGLAFQVDQATVSRYKGFGINLEKASGFSHHTLPIPAVFIVDRSGNIVYVHSNPDYRDRLDPKTILTELEKLK